MSRDDRKLGSRAFAARRWQAAFDHLSRAQRNGTLGPAEAAALVAQLLGPA